MSLSETLRPHQLERPQVVHEAKPELIAATAELALRHFPNAGRAYLLNDVESEQWTDIARDWGSKLSEDFRFNRGKRIFHPEGKFAHSGMHLDNPDFQGEIDMLITGGLAKAIVPDIDQSPIELIPGANVRLVGWPTGVDYPAGRRPQSKLTSDDPRTAHNVHSMRLRDGTVLSRSSVVLSFDADPANPKNIRKFT